MAISYADRFRIADGHETDFAYRALAALHRHATHVLNVGTAPENELQAARVVWQNVSNYRFPVALALLNDQFVNKPSSAASDISDLEIEAAINDGETGLWIRFVAVYFPAPAED